MHANLGTIDVSGKVHDQAAHPSALTGGSPTAFPGLWREISFHAGNLTASLQVSSAQQSQYWLQDPGVTVGFNWNVWAKFTFGYKKIQTTDTPCASANLWNVELYIRAQNVCHKQSRGKRTSTHPTHTHPHTHHTYTHARTHALKYITDQKQHSEKKNLAFVTVAFGVQWHRK